MRLVIKSCFIAALAVLLVAACAADAPARVDTRTDATLAPVPAEFAGRSNPLKDEADGPARELFRTNCEPCHGPQGLGDGPAGQVLEPPPGNLAALQSRAGDDYLFWRIHDGKPGTAMIAWRGILTEEQIWQLVSHLRTLR